ncbi:MAG: dephospho-CoA kinase [Chitinophagaceae bacterium]
MLKIGLTGGIGSGKSTVAKIFETLGIPVYYADEAARRLINEDEEVKSSIIKHFGKENYTEGKLNRTYISSQVFNNKEKLALLNSLTHPATINDSNKWIAEQTSPYVIKEAALLFESGSMEYLDLVIGVYAPAALRIKRTIERDNTTREEVIKRIGRQIDEQIKMKLCNFVITNDEHQLVVPQVMKLHEQFLVLSKSSAKEKTI